jgi:hypothetical protein
MIGERTLKRWRKEALNGINRLDVKMYGETAPGLAIAYQECQKRILRMTQELLDLHLTREK